MKGIKFLGAALALTLIAVACGSDTADEPTTTRATTTTAAATTTMATTTTAMEDDMDDMAEDTTTTAAATTTAATTTTEATPDTTAPAPMEPRQVAYLSASSANTWLAASRTAMEEVAAANNINMVEFDAQFTFDRQVSQFQDVVATGQYDGIIISALGGAAHIPDILDALDAGIKVVGLNQVIGTDFTTVEPQVPGMSAMVFEPPYQRGVRLGELTVQACEGLDPCNVVYFYGIKGIPLDVAVRQGWDDTVAGSGVTEVAEAEGNYLGPDVGLAAMQDILVRTSDIDLVLGADQSMQGAEIALNEAGMTDVRILGFGGSGAGVAAVKEGRWWGNLYGAPYTEGQLSMEAMVAALDGNDLGGVDPSQSVPNRGLMTQDNADEFDAQWDG